MHKNTYIILGSLTLIVALSVGFVWYVRPMQEPEPTRPIGVLPDANIVKPEDHPIPELPEDKWPYERLDERLYVQKGITLDPNVITINNELKDVKLCHDTYKTKQVLIDGVDVVQRVSELFKEASTTTSDKVCALLWRNVPEFGGNIDTGEELQIIILQDQGDPDYLVGISINKSLYNRLLTWDTGLHVRVSTANDRVYFGKSMGPDNISGTLHDSK